MFEDERKNLIVVYKEKDELALNQLKKMIDSKSDDSKSGKIIGTEDGTVNIVAWTEKTWIDNKKAGSTGTLDDKILFIGDIKGVDKLIPTLDIKFNQYGVSYGFSGKQAAIIIDPKPLMKKNYYDSFIEELKRACDAKTVNEKRHFDYDTKSQYIKNEAMRMAVTVFGGVFGAAWNLATLVGYAFGDAKTIRNQQLLLAVSKLYLNHLDEFMKK